MYRKKQVYILVMFERNIFLVRPAWNATWPPHGKRTRRGFSPMSIIMPTIKSSNIVGKTEKRR